MGDSLYTPEVALAGYMALAGKWAMGSYPYWIRTGDSVHMLQDAVATISPREIEESCSRLLDMLSKDGAKGVETARTVELPKLCEAIEHGWGESSQWASDSRAHMENLRITSESGGVKQSTKKAKSQVGVILRNHAPRIYGRLRPDHDYTLDRGIGFKDYASAHAPGSYEVANDLLTIAEIWKSYPEGVTQGSLSKTL
jgi:hypothetical protein